jgi:sugar phosphate isomerase/epimerase
MFWAGRDNLEEIASLGVRCGQLGLPGDLDLTGGVAREYKEALDRTGFTVVTVFAAYQGEDYADIPTVARTVGFIPSNLREEREHRTYEVSDLAAKLGVASIATHVGFIPDTHDPSYLAVRNIVRRICDHARGNGQTFALETGQERAHALLQFLEDVGRPNVGVNFDPANMILYGTGDPIEALSVLGPRVLSVHVKDGDWPLRDQPQALGKERALGRGAVGIPRFLAKLKEIDFRGPLNIEREAENQLERMADIRNAVAYLKKLTTSD